MFFLTKTYLQKLSWKKYSLAPVDTSESEAEEEVAEEQESYSPIDIYSSGESSDEEIVRIGLKPKPPVATVSKTDEIIDSLGKG